MASATRCPAAPRPLRQRARVQVVRCCEDTLGVPRSRRPTYDGEQDQAQRFPELVTPYGASSYLPHTQHYPPPPRPRRIVLVRHGESEGNVDEAAYTRVPDPRIGLTPRGWRHAEDCGRSLRRLVSTGAGAGDDWKVYFYVSPYRRTLETLRGLGRAFEAQRIAGVREEPRLREQDFGNFQDREKMRVEKEIRRRYGRFFYRFPNGESAADVYDRITGFRETLRADIDIGRFQPPGERNPEMNVVLVSHGLTLRVFLMRWYKWTVRQFEGLNNLANGGAVVMQTGSGGRYSLLVHHSVEELREFGLTDDMIEDQMWQKTARPGELNYNFITNGPSFFTHFNDHAPLPTTQQLDQIDQIY
ncbi:phosphoglycerate mutase-like protein AT74H [Oryza brachyantha]|uniref:phosphoglycerate mutase-like protein AT74H n=1 Tax=Oryza brachyantha TaxID=4533 RepID=UPI001ADCC7F2|nr:phosphoglycerate mutase-like protein AT74H [Oryza brachyantha]